MRALRAILGHAIDYAGLFPPASLDLESVVRGYAEYYASEQAWALGRIILPASMLSGFSMVKFAATDQWPVSVLLGPDFERDIASASQQLRRFDTFECKPEDAKQIDEILRLLPTDAQIFFEVDGSEASSDLIAAISHAGACAKIRTGGVTANAIPSSGTITRLLSLFAQYQVPFKATAGLHHPLRGERALTYSADAPLGSLHGFINLTFAAALLYLGAAGEEACAVLNEMDAKHFHMDEEGLMWRQHRLSTEQIATVRREFMLCFGSCSFTEPLEDVRALGWLP